MSWASTVFFWDLTGERQRWKYAQFGRWLAGIDTEILIGLDCFFIDLGHSLSHVLVAGGNFGSIEFALEKRVKLEAGAANVPWYSDCEEALITWASKMDSHGRNVRAVDWILDSRIRTNPMVCPRQLMCDVTGSSWFLNRKTFGRIR